MISTSDQPDSELIARSRLDPAVFAEIFDRHHGELYRYLRRRAGGGLAADLAAETFVTAFARRASYRPQGSSARPWLYGIAHNLLRNHLRHEQRRLAAYARHGAEPTSDAAALAEFSLADARADAEAGTARLTRILAGMAARDRDALLLFAWADMSYAEVAQALGVPVGTVRSRLNRARRQLRALAEDETVIEVLGENHG
ncbi:MAG TPA: RNA polymerase sigma factor [Streptosporangiaceae bacterium]|nr:RNA polymerase sigma factor [Streptosporangiaceae bacterium]